MSVISNEVRDLSLVLFSKEVTKNMKSFVGTGFKIHLISDLRALRAEIYLTQWRMHNEIVFLIAL